MASGVGTKPGAHSMPRTPRQDASVSSDLTARRKMTHPRRCGLWLQWCIDVRGFQRQQVHLYHTPRQEDLPPTAMLLACKVTVGPLPGNVLNDEELGAAEAAGAPAPFDPPPADDGPTPAPPRAGRGRGRVGRGRRGRGGRGGGSSGVAAAAFAEEEESSSTPSSGSSSSSDSSSS